MLNNISILMPPGLHIGQLWNASWVTSVSLHHMFCIYSLHHLVIFRRSQMRIAFLMTGGPRGAMLSSLVLTWSPRMLAIKLQCLAVVLKLSKRQLLMPQLRLFGYSHCWENWESINLSHRSFGVTTSALHIFHRIRYFTPEQNILNWTIILWGHIKFISSKD
jgi:hypothetical protein